jgi:hypothetical protein
MTRREDTPDPRRAVIRDAAATARAVETLAQQASIALSFAVGAISVGSRESSAQLLGVASDLIETALSLVRQSEATLAGEALALAEQFVDRARRGAAS